MPEYLYPGVYVEEISSGNKPIEGVSTSTAGFFGIAERGPLDATLVVSFADYVRSFGGYVQEKGADRFLAYAVEGFFQNGGQRCFVQRCVSSDPSTKPAAATAGGLVLSALGPGVSGNRIAFRVTPGSQAAATGAAIADSFKLTVIYWAPNVSVPGLDGGTGTLVDPTDPANSTNTDLRSPTFVEVYDNLNSNPLSSSYVVTSVNGLSTLVTVATDTSAIAPVGLTLLAGGNDGATLKPEDFVGKADAAPGEKRGLSALEEIDEISLLCCPDEYYFANPTENSVISKGIVNQCELTKFRFAILQSPLHADPPGRHFPTVFSKYAAYYYPWLNIVNPETGLLTLTPPGGHIAGIYARSDNTRNVAKDPANEPIAMIDSLQVQITNQQQAILNPVGVNVLRYFKGAGNLVWGGRTTSPDVEWRYINVRRLFIFIEKSIQDGTKWAVFEPNDTPLWTRLIRSVSDFLSGLWKDGMLQGATKEQAYFVRCDRTTMTQADIDLGRLIMLIGVAPVKPAEFVIFRIGQWDGGSSVAEV